MDQNCEQCNMNFPANNTVQAALPIQGIILYSTNCPKCAVLERKLDSLNITYEKNTSIDDMVALGMKSVPMLSVDGELLNFTAANEWLNNQNQEDEP